MVDTELIERLKKLTESGIKIREIEEAIKFPKNNLSAILNGKKPLPQKRKQNLILALLTFEDAVQLKSMTPEDWQRQFKVLTDDDLLKIWTDYLQKGEPFLTIPEDGRIKVIDPFGIEGIKYWREAIKKYDADQKQPEKPGNAPNPEEKQKDDKGVGEEKEVVNKPKKDYGAFMAEAKSGFLSEEDEVRFRRELSDSKATPGQKAMIISKINRKND